MLRATLRDVLEKALPAGKAIRTMGADEPLAEYGLDSLAMVELVELLQIDLGITVDEDDLEGDHFVSLARLEELVRRKQGGSHQ